MENNYNNEAINYSSQSKKKRNIIAIAVILVSLLTISIITVVILQQRQGLNPNSTIIPQNNSDLFFDPSSKTLSKEGNFTVQVRVNAKGQLVNAIQANITYPSTLLDVISVKSESEFEIGAQKTIEEGKIILAYGTTTPKSGDHLVATITFKAKSPGTAEVSFIDGSFVASSVTNTNILGNKISAIFTIQE